MMNNFSHVLNDKNSKLNNICLKSQQIIALNKIYRKYITDPIKDQFTVANIRDNCLILEFSSAAWATKGKFIYDKLLEIAKKEFHNIEKIDLYIKPR